MATRKPWTTSSPWLDNGLNRLIGWLTGSQQGPQALALEQARLEQRQLTLAHAMDTTRFGTNPYVTGSQHGRPQPVGRLDVRR